MYDGATDELLHTYWRRIAASSHHTIPPRRYIRREKKTRRRGPAVEDGLVQDMTVDRALVGNSRTGDHYRSTSVEDRIRSDRHWTLAIITVTSGAAAAAAAVAAVAGGIQL